MAGDLIFVLVVVLVIAGFAIALTRRDQRKTQRPSPDAEGIEGGSGPEEPTTPQKRTIVLASGREEQYWNLVHQTASFRYSVIWKGARRLMAERGLAASDIIPTAFEQGDDIHATFVARDGNGISCDFLEDRQTRAMVAVHEWDEFSPVAAAREDAYGYADEVLAVEIFGDEQLRDAFDRAVLAYFDFHWRCNDRPLPPRYTHSNLK